MNALASQDLDGFGHRIVAASDGYDAPLGGLAPLDDGRGNQRGGRLPLANQPVHDFLVLVGVFGVAAVLVVPGAAHKVGALASSPGIGPIRYAVPVHVQVAVERLGGFQFLRAEHLAAVRPVGVVPFKVIAHPVVHADVQVQHHHYRGLQPVRQVEGLHGKLEALVGIGREQQHVAGVTVGGIGSRKDIGLLGTRRHAGGRADALHVEEHRREFGEIGIADELAHERQPGSAGRREGPRPVPGGAEHDTDGRQFIFRLDDAVVACARFAIDPVPLAKRLERIHQRG